MNDYLANDKGLGVEAATSLLMCFGLGAMGGTVGGGVVGQRLYNASPVYATTFMGAAAVAGIFPWLFLVHADDYDGNDASAMSRKCAVAIFAGLLCSVTGVNVRAMTVNVNDPRERGTAFAWFNLTDDLGKGFGPVLIAYLIHRMGRQNAFELGFWFWVPCGVLCALCGLTVPKDEARVRREAESLRRGYSVGGEGETASLLGKGGDKMV
jgi:predicted MFS family arabinose efflux permease